jgi:hypothetical protein
LSKPRKLSVARGPTKPAAALCSVRIRILRFGHRYEAYAPCSFQNLWSSIWTGALLTFIEELKRRQQRCIGLPRSLLPTSGKKFIFWTRSGMITCMEHRDGFDSLKISSTTCHLTRVTLFIDTKRQQSILYDQKKSTAILLFFEFTTLVPLPPTMYAFFCPTTLFSYSMAAWVDPANQFPILLARVRTPSCARTATAPGDLKEDKDKGFLVLESPLPFPG